MFKNQLKNKGSFESNLDFFNYKKYHFYMITLYLLHSIYRLITISHILSQTLCI